MSVCFKIVREKSPGRKRVKDKTARDSNQRPKNTAGWKFGSHRV